MGVVALLIMAFACMQLGSPFLCRKCLTMSPGHSELFREHGAWCQKRTLISQEKALQLEKGILADDTTLIPHVFCVLKKGKVIDKKGNITRLRNFKNIIIAERCNILNAATPEARAWVIFRCANWT